MIKHLAGKTVFISGASRGIGKAIALRCARDGANVIIAAKTAEPHPKLPGTIYSAAKEIEEAGGNCLPCTVDIRYEDQVTKAMEEGAKKFGGIDILINNASAISLTGTLDTSMKKYDLMNQVNARGTFLCSKVALPYLLKSKNPHILNLSPPLSLNPKWFKNNVAYTIAKYGMSFCVLGMSEEYKDDGIAVNALWPRTAIATDAIDLIGSVEMRKQSRTVDIMSDAAYQILIKDSRTFTGKFVIDEEILRKECGITNFDKYAVDPTQSLMLDFFVDEEANVNSESLVGLVTKDTKKQESSTETQQQNTNDISDVISSMKNLLSADLVQKINGVYGFNISDATTPNWFLDLKSENGSIGLGEFSGKTNCTITTTSDVFRSMTEGKLKPTTAFMSGKLKIKGDVSLAMKLEKLMGDLKTQPSKPATEQSNVSNVAASMEKIKHLISPDLIQKMNGVYLFKITDSNPTDWYLDLKNGPGCLTNGEYKDTVNCTMTMTSDVFNNMVDGSLKPTSAFMSGKLKIKGDMGLAMKLEKLMSSLKSKL